MLKGTARGRVTAALVAGAMLVVAAGAQAVVLNVGQGVAAPDGEVTIGVILNTEGATVVGTQNDINFASANLSVPEKVVTITLTANINATETTIPLSDTTQLEEIGTIEIENETIDYSGKDATSVTGAVRGSGGTTAAAHNAGAQVEVPAGPNCRVGSEVDGAAFFSYTDGGIRAIVLSFGDDDVAPIPNGTVLYTCTFKASATAVVGDEFPLTCAGPGSSDNMETPMSLPTTCGNGNIDIASGCLGDCSEPMGTITASELASTINGFGRRNPALNPCADRDGDGIEASELATVINNFGRRQCNP